MTKHAEGEGAALPEVKRHDVALLPSTRCQRCGDEAITERCQYCRTLPGSRYLSGFKVVIPEYQARSRIAIPDTEEQHVARRVQATYTYRWGRVRYA